MNLWRCLGITICLLGVLCLVGTTKFPVHAAKDPKDVKAEDKKEKKPEEKKPEEKKPEEKKPEEKKPEEKKPEEKKPEETPKKTTGGGETLPNKMFEGKPFFQEQFTKTTQKMTVMNQQVVQEQKQTFIIKWTPKDKKGDDWVIEQEIVDVKMDIDIGGNKISYDSKGAKQKNPMTDFFEALTKSKLTFTIGKDLSVKSIEGREAFIKSLSDINPQMNTLLKAILSEDALKKMAEPTWWAYPEGGTVAKDQSWTKNSKLDLGPIGTYKTDFTFTYLGQADSKDKIGIKTKLEYTAPSEKQGLPFTIKSATLTSEKGEGEALFNRTAGRFEKTTINMKLNGKLEIEVGNMTTPVTLEQEQTAITTNHGDANPWDKKAQ